MAFDLGPDPSGLANGEPLDQFDRLLAGAGSLVDVCWRDHRLDPNGS